MKGPLPLSYVNVNTIWSINTAINPRSYCPQRVVFLQPFVSLLLKERKEERDTIHWWLFCSGIVNRDASISIQQLSGALLYIDKNHSVSRLSSGFIMHAPTGTPPGRSHSYSSELVVELFLLIIKAAFLYLHCMSKLNSFNQMNISYNQLS